MLRTKYFLRLEVTCRPSAELALLNLDEMEVALLVLASFTDSRVGVTVATALSVRLCDGECFWIAYVIDLMLALSSSIPSIDVVIILLVFCNGSR